MICIELNPIPPTNLVKVRQKREDIDHSLRHGFEIGLIKPQRRPEDIQTCERALWQRA